MSPIGVMVVDDSTVVRRLVTDALQGDPDIRVLGTAPNGKIALAKMAQLNPDVITLDVEMPVMDGIETIRELRKLYPDVPVIMFSTLTERGATATFQALSYGANDYVTKPSNMGSVSQSIEVVRKELVPRVKALYASRRRSGIPAARAPGTTGAPGTRVPPRPGTGPAAPAAPAAPTAPHRLPAALRPSTPSASPGTAGSYRVDSPLQRSAGDPAAQAARPILSPQAPSGAAAPTSRVDLVVIGTSTGGPEALAAVVGQLPAGLPVPIALVQHMPPIFTRLLAERLTRLGGPIVNEATNGQRMEPGQIYLAPGDFHLEVVFEGMGMRTRLQQGPPENSCRPAVDVLFRSAAQRGGSVLAVVLTGMGSDGRRGAEDLKAKGAKVYAQDEATSVVWGMPGAVAGAGLADDVLPLSAVAPAIVSALAVGRSPLATARTTGKTP